MEQNTGETPGGSLASVTIENGGTSPTNTIETLAVDMWKRFYPNDRFETIEWYDCWPPGYSLTGSFQRVLFPAERGGPIRVPARDAPADFVEEVRHVITPKAAAVLADAL